VLSEPGVFLPQVQKQVDEVVELPEDACVAPCFPAQTGPVRISAHTRLQRRQGEEHGPGDNLN
jgi:hypothetical protein